MITAIKNSKKRSLSDYPYYILKTSQQKQYPFHTRHSSNERNYLIMIFHFYFYIMITIIAVISTVVLYIRRNQLTKRTPLMVLAVLTAILAIFTIYDGYRIKTMNTKFVAAQKKYDQAVNRSDKTLRKIASTSTYDIYWEYGVRQDHKKAAKNMKIMRDNNTGTYDRHSKTAKVKSLSYEEKVYKRYRKNYETVLTLGNRNPKYMISIHP